jgi:hypothetical protein
MLQLTPQSRIFVATEPVDFRKGIDGLAAICHRALGDNPLSGALYVFRNRAGTTLKILCYDGQGFWLCTKRLSQGRFTWWPKTQDASTRLSARELVIVLWNGNPQQAMADDWKSWPKAGRVGGNSTAAKRPGRQNRRTVLLQRDQYSAHSPQRGRGRESLEHLAMERYVCGIKDCFPLPNDGFSPLTRYLVSGGPLPVKTG